MCIKKNMIHIISRRNVDRQADSRHPVDSRHKDGAQTDLGQATNSSTTPMASAAATAMRSSLTIPGRTPPRASAPAAALSDRVRTPMPTTPIFGSARGAGAKDRRTASCARNRRLTPPASISNPPAIGRLRRDAEKPRESLAGVHRVGDRHQEMGDAQRAIGMALPFATPHEVRRQMLAKEDTNTLERRRIDADDPEPGVKRSFGERDRPRKFLGRLRRLPVFGQAPVERFGSRAS